MSTSVGPVPADDSFEKGAVRAHVAAHLNEEVDGDGGINADAEGALDDSSSRDDGRSGEGSGSGNDRGAGGDGRGEVDNILNIVALTGLRVVSAGDN